MLTNQVDQRFAVYIYMDTILYAVKATEYAISTLFLCTSDSITIASSSVHPIHTFYFTHVVASSNLVRGVIIFTRSAIKTAQIPYCTNNKSMYHFVNCSGATIWECMHNGLYSFSAILESNSLAKPQVYTNVRNTTFAAQHCSIQYSTTHWIGGWK